MGTMIRMGMRRKKKIRPHRTHNDTHRLEIPKDLLAIGSIASPASTFLDLQTGYR
jgi:hypothetical protein